MDKLIDNLKKGINAAKSEAGRMSKAIFDKTSNIVDITKLNIAKNDAESKAEKLYAQIGKIIYTQYKDGNEFESKIGDICIEIDKFEAEAEELKEQIAALKNTVQCAGCGQFNDKSNEYCSKCGAKLVPIAETIVPDDIIDAEPSSDESAADEVSEVVDVTPKDAE